MKKTNIKALIIIALITGFATILARPGATSTAFKGHSVIAASKVIVSIPQKTVRTSSSSSYSSSSSSSSSRSSSNSYSGGGSSYGK